MVELGLRLQEDRASSGRSLPWPEVESSAARGKAGSIDSLTARKRL